MSRGTRVAAAACCSTGFGADTAPHAGLEAHGEIDIDLHVLDKPLHRGRKAFGSHRRPEVEREFNVLPVRGPDDQVLGWRPAELPEIAHLDLEYPVPRQLDYTHAGPVVHIAFQVPAYPRAADQPQSALAHLDLAQGRIQVRAHIPQAYA